MYLVVIIILIILLLIYLYWRPSIDAIHHYDSYIILIWYNAKKDGITWNKSIVRNYIKIEINI